MSKLVTVAICFMASTNLMGECLESGIEEQFAQADIVFLGKPTDVMYTCSLGLENQPARDAPMVGNCFGGNSVSRVEILEIYKNSWGWLDARANEIGIVLVAYGSIDGLHVTKDREYLVFAKKLAGDMYYSGGCDGSTVTEFGGRQVPNLDKIIEFLENQSAP